jgi:aldehyde dehydrogenase (NAD+)
MAATELLQGSGRPAAQQAQEGSSPQAYSTFEQQFIGGKWRTADGQRLQDRNPYIREVIIEIPQASAQDLEEAHAAAAAARHSWAAALPAARVAVMRRAAEIMERRHEEIVSWPSELVGPWREAEPSNAPIT